MPVPAAQYLRMSTEHQQYSTVNQAAAIQLYATLNGFTIVKTYADEGRSGLVIGGRPKLQQLLKDVTSGKAEFKVILVYDVSRWGRFQDMDEAAHYEFLCKKAGVPVHYCQEAFANDGAMANLILKWLKRAMAGEFSRELSCKTLAGAKRLAAMGFRQGGSAGYGLQRMLVTQERVPKQLLKRGERKSITEDRILIVPGSPEEVRNVKRIFNWFIRKRMMPTEIANRLNKLGIPFTNGIKHTHWNETIINRLLKNPKYAGWLVYGRSTQRMHTPVRFVPKEHWVCVPNAWTPLVSIETFEAAQKIFKEQTRWKSDDDLLNHLRKLLQQHGRLSMKIIMDAGGPSVGTYQYRFGGLFEAMKLVGYEHPQVSFRTSLRQLKSVRRKIIQELIETSPVPISIARRNGDWRERLVFENGISLSVSICRHQPVEGCSRWVLEVGKDEYGAPALIARMAPGNTEILDFFLLPKTRRCRHTLLSNRHALLQSAVRIKSLSEVSKLVSRYVTKKMPNANGSSTEHQSIRIRFA